MERIVDGDEDEGEGTLIALPAGLLVGWIHRPNPSSDPRLVTEVKLRSQEGMRGQTKRSGSKAVRDVGQSGSQHP